LRVGATIIVEHECYVIERLRFDHRLKKQQRTGLCGRWDGMYRNVWKLMHLRWRWLLPLLHWQHRQ
jgi:hypothetical protein